MRALAAMVFAGIAIAHPSFAQQRDWTKVEIEATKLGDTVYMLTGLGGNLGLSVGEDAVFLIDDQYAPLTDKISAAIQKITPKPVKFVLNTHWHPDHTGGNENLGKGGVLIFAHENARKRLSSEQFLEHVRLAVKPSPAVALPVVTFDGVLSFHINGEEIRGVHVPRAHTDGDTIVHFLRSDVVHMGDVYWNGGYPVIDTRAGGTLDGMVAACDKVLAIASDKTRIIPGHGPLSDRAGLETYRDILATVLERVKKMVAEGRKLEEIVAAGVTRDFDEKWGKAYIPPAKFVETVAAELLSR